jgi:hypothetical protein
MFGLVLDLEIKCAFSYSRSANSFIEHGSPPLSPPDFELDNEIGRVHCNVSSSPTRLHVNRIFLFRQVVKNIYCAGGIAVSQEAGEALVAGVEPFRIYRFESVSDHILERFVSPLALCLEFTL